MLYFFRQANARVSAGDCDAIQRAILDVIAKCGKTRCHLTAGKDAHLP